MQSQAFAPAFVPQCAAGASESDGEALPGSHRFALNWGVSFFGVTQNAGFACRSQVQAKIHLNRIDLPRNPPDVSHLSNTEACELFGTGQMPRRSQAREGCPVLRNINMVWCAENGDHATVRGISSGSRAFTRAWGSTGCQKAVER